MKPGFTTDQAAAICAHMNDDHRDATAAYARVYGAIPAVESATMVALDATGMELRVETGRGTLVKRIDFDHELTDTVDARETLIAMARHAMS